MAGCDATDKVKALLRKMAAAKIEEGHTDPETILSHIHDAIQDHTPLHRGEIADIITGHGGQKATKTDLQNRVAAFMSELRDLRKVQDTLGKEPPKAASKDPARAAAIERQIGELQRQIDYGENALDAKTKAGDSPQITALKAQRDDLKQQLQNTKPSPPATRPLDPNETRNKALRTSLQNRIADLETKIAAGDTTDQGKFKFKRDEQNKALQARVDALKQELNNLKPSPPAIFPKDRNVLKNAARQKVIEKQMAQLQDRIAKGDYSKPEPRKSPLYTTDTQKMQARLNDVRAEFEKNARAAEAQNRSTAAKVGDMLVELHRAAILTSPNVLLKLPATALSNIAIRPALLEPVGQGLRRLLPGIAAKAPSEGGAGGYFGPEGAALKKTFSAETGKAMADYAKTGTHELSSLYGKRDVDFQSNLKLAQYIGNIHGALKVPAAINQWSRAVLHRTAHEANSMRAAKASEDAIAQHLADPATQAKIAAEAWADAEREIFQNPNMLSDAYAAMLGNLRAKGHTGAERAFRFLFPITKVPTNITIASSSYAGGAIGAVTRLMQAADKGMSNKLMLKNAVSNLSGEQADSIMRNLKRQGVGIAAMAIGWYFYHNFGGMYQQGDSRNKLKPDSESIKIGGLKITKQVLEHPLLTAMQLGATAAWVAHKPKGDKATGAFAAATSLAERNPFVRGAADIGGALSSWKGAQKFAGQQVSSMNPQIIQMAARKMDTDSTGKEIKRSPKEFPGRASIFTQQIETGIPGLRKNVPRSPNQ